MPNELSGLIGYGLGMVAGSVILAWIVSVLTRGLGIALKKPDWHGWYAGLGIACFGCLGQVVSGNLFGIGASFVGALIVWLIADAKSKKPK